MWQNREHLPLCTIPFGGLLLVRSGHACYKAEQRERKRNAQQAEQKGKQHITQLFAAAAAKKQKKTD